MWLIDLIPGIPTFGLFLFLECLVSVLFIWWVFIDDQRYI